MSARVSDEELVRYYDGELEAADAERVERLLRDDPHAERALEGLEQLGDVMRAWADRRGAAHDDLVNDVLARIARDGDQPESRVLPLHGSGPARRLRRAAVVITGALSLAAAAAVAVRVAQAPPPVSTPALPVAQTHSLAEPATSSSSVVVAEVQLEADPAASIESVDFGAHAGSIFVIAGTEGDVPVVWLLDDAADRMQPL
jgi:anti-sigma factor RsiW